MGLFGKRDEPKPDNFTKDEWGDFSKETQRQVNNAKDNPPPKGFREPKPR